MSAFSDPQSFFRKMRQTPCFLTVLRYKATGTIIIITLFKIDKNVTQVTSNKIAAISLDKR